VDGVARVSLPAYQVAYPTNGTHDMMCVEGMRCAMWMG
jgi:hypothetical protein